MTSETLYNLILTTAQENTAILMIGSEGSRNDLLLHLISTKISTSPTLFQMMSFQLSRCLIAVASAT